jgi:hypothetical protein
MLSAIAVVGYVNNDPTVCGRPPCPQLSGNGASVQDPYRWNLSGYFQWSGGGDCCQTTPNHIALAWGGGGYLGLKSYYA